MSFIKHDSNRPAALALTCHQCGTGPGEPCWPNGNVHPDRHVTKPGPRIQILDPNGFNIIYDSRVDTRTPEQFLAALGDHKVKIKVIGRYAEHEVVWSGTMETGGDTEMKSKARDDDTKDREAERDD